jgi:D-alanyl-D-alanine carboxypeptidase/D-alanyl-D-alanine-endopeptidase (penicillin-binding protein 4)
VVIDPRTGTDLLASDADGPRVPASTSKLLTAAAVLAGAQPTDVLRTRVLTGTVAGHVVLVGGGDPTLTDRPVARGTYPRPATLDGLAAATAAALKARGLTSVSLAVDDSLFGGPRTAPGWQPGYLPGGVVAPVTALMVDEGRRRPGHDARYPDPAAAAGQAFARRLAAHGVKVTGRVSRAVAPTGATEIAGVESPTLPVLVESMLSRSDNDLAEALARHVALGAGQPATFAGVRVALGAALSGLGLDLAGVVLNDGSGLSRTSQVSPRLLGEVLALAYSPDHERLRPLLSGLPVAGFTGTLADRFAAAAARGAVGNVRAKTGTLTGVSALAGVTVDADGAPLVFAVMADGVPVAKTLQARDALDLAAARLAGCGCR